MSTLGIRVNLRTGGASQYAGLDYNSLGAVGGVLVGVNENGLYSQTGDSQTAFFETRHSDLNVPKSKKVRAVILSGVFDGSLDITTVIDGSELETVRVDSEAVMTQKNYVIPFSSEHQGMYVGVKIANVNGADFSVHQISVVYIVTDKKWATTTILGRLKQATPFPSMVAS